MNATEVLPLHDLYVRDETAWLEIMAHLAAVGRHAEMDLPNLSEYLTDMANRDRREVASRMVLLLTHLLKWEYQPDHRTGSWQATILEQRRALRKLLEGGTLRNHADAILAETYADAVKQMVVETGLLLETIPAESAWDVDDLLADD